MAQILGKHVLQRAGQLPKVAARLVLGEPRALAALEQLGEIARVTVLDAEMEKRKNKEKNQLFNQESEDGIARDHRQRAHERNETQNNNTETLRARTLNACTWAAFLCGRGDEEYWDGAFEP